MFKALFERMLLILLTPSKAWERIVAERPNETEVRSNYVFPFVGIATLASFIGLAWRQDLPTAIKGACITFVSLFAGYLLASFLLNEILDYFKIGKSQARSQVFVGYASTVVYAMHAILDLQLLPEFFFLQIFELYTVYVVWESIGIYYHIQEEKKLFFVISVSLIIMLSPFLISNVLKLLMPGI